MAASIITLFTLLYLSVGILLLCRKHAGSIITLFTLLYLSVGILLYVESTCMAASIITLFTLLYLSVGILLLCREHLHGRFYNTVHTVIFECWHITPM